MYLNFLIKFKCHFGKNWHLKKLYVLKTILYKELNLFLMFKKTKIEYVLAIFQLFP